MSIQKYWVYTYMEHRQIGYFSQDVIDLLKLNTPSGTPIYIGQTNIEHIKKRHPYEYDAYYNKIEDIIAYPDYVGQNPSDKSISTKNQNNV